MIDGAGRILAINLVAQQVLGANSELVGAPISSLIATPTVAVLSRAGMHICQLIDRRVICFTKLIGGLACLNLMSGMPGDSDLSLALTEASSDIDALPSPLPALAREVGLKVSDVQRARARVASRIGPRRTRRAAQHALSRIARADGRLVRACARSPLCTFRRAALATAHRAARALTRPPRTPRARVVAQVLLVEDDEFQANMMRDMCEHNGFAIDVCVNGPDALHRIFDPSSAFNLVLLDLVMAPMHGLDILKAIRARDERLTVVIISNSDEKHMVKVCTAGPGDGHRSPDRRLRRAARTRRSVRKPRAYHPPLARSAARWSMLVPR